MRKTLTVALGLVLLSSQPMVASAQNLVVNPGFETGDFSGWTQWGDTGFSGVDDFNPNSGTYAAYFGPFTLGGIFQNIATVAGETYEFSFWLHNDSGAPNYFDVLWNSTTLVQLIDATPFGYTMYSFEVEGTGSDFIDFGFAHEPGFWELDDVSVTLVERVVPEPASMALLGIGLIGLASRVRIRRRSEA